jgi:catechol 2,3-dioxygenase-like lactoylglutathione lyase family enzyme
MTMQLPELMGQPVRQIAYFVPDVRAAALAHAKAFGSGPYFVADNIPLATTLHRGREAVFDHSSAYGQWGEMMVEFMQQNNPGPSVLHDMYPEGSGRQGLHHLAILVDNLDRAEKALNDAGFPTALRASMTDGFTFLMIDTVAVLGHMIELYEKAPRMIGFYDFVRDAAKDFDGKDIIRNITVS